MHIRSVGAAVVALVVATAAPAFVATPAQATAYRYWSYWAASGGSWSWAQVGAHDTTMRDGSVQGWRFAVTTDSRSATGPREAAAGAFTKVCGDVTRPDDRIRVALVVDFGIGAHTRPGDTLPAQPLRGTCELVAPGSSGWDVLVAAGYSIRTDDSSMICALAGYPSKGCGEAVADPPKTSAPRTSTSAPGATSTSRSRQTAREQRGRDKNRRDDGSAATGTRAASSATPGSTSTTGSADGGTTADPQASDRPSSAGTDLADVDVPAAEASPTLVASVPDAPVSDDGGPGGLLGAGIGLAALVALGGAAVVRGRRS